MKRLIFSMRTLALVIALLSGVTLWVSAQDQPSAISADQVNAIAKKLYCPVCENITLDTCATAACEDWRNEIKLQLEAGRTEEQIVDDFVQRFGDRVVGTPQDSVLRALSLITPWILIGGVLLLLGKMLLNRNRTRQASMTTAPPDNSVAQKYEDLLEQDLEG